MTTYRLMDGVAGRPGNGPGSPTAYAGPFLAGIRFGVTTGGMWLNGYYHWVPAGGDTVARKFALWCMTSTSAGVLIAGSTVTSGTLTAGTWNFVPLAVPIQLALGTQYIAATGWQSVNGFPDTSNQFATGDPYVNGITNGPLVAWSDGTAGGTNNGIYPMVQGVFSIAGTDPSVNMPTTGSNSSNFWVDIQVGDTAPAGYGGTYRIWPDKADTNGATVADLNVDYVVATEITLTQPCTLNRIWYYSPAGTAQLATSADIWSIQGANAGTVVAGTDSPSWSGAAASGWVSCSFTGVLLGAGSYKVSVFNNAASPDGWSAKDASTNYWGSGGAGVSGITWGPISAPGLATASLAYEFNGNAGGTPPFSNGITERGQCTFAQSGTNIYPYLYVDGLAQNYWVDAEVTPVQPNVIPAMPQAASPARPPVTVVTGAGWRNAGHSR